MAIGYTREFLVCAFADKYRVCSKTEEYFLDFKQRIGYDHYDKVGKAQFRKDTSLDAAAIKLYKESLK